jgi:adenylate cyclase class 2
MEIEYEATFTNIDKEQLRKKLESLKAVIIKKEFLQKRATFNLPKGHEIKGGWIRLRDEDDKITLTLKIVDGENIENQKETCLEVNDFEQAENFLKKIGCEKKAFQESKREIWKIENVEIMIDEWPFLEPFVEIEGSSEKEVREVSEKLGFGFSKALFCSITTLYSQKYNIPEEIINNKIPRICFNEENPFLEISKDQDSLNG